MYVAAYAPYGAEGIIIRVEADIRRGIPGIDITGLAEGAVREARERVRAAFRNSGYTFPADRILINLAPAGVRKEGASLDLPIAVSVMAAAGLIPAPDKLMVLGELELSGRLRPVRGILAATAAGLKAGIQDFIVPAENAGEAAILAGDRFFAAATLGETVHALLVKAETGRLPENGFDREKDGGYVSDIFDGNSGDFSEVRGQARYKRALEIAAAGGHNLLVFGPPGAGKTMLARRIPSIMPPLEPEEAVEVTRLHSLAGQLSMRPGACSAGNALERGGELIRRPPFRSPHHSASAEGILGGGRSVRPGEITLAHWGVLFLDEAPEFKAPVLQSLREPLEDKVVTIVRAEGPVWLPADFQLILAANSCPCGRLGEGKPGNSHDCFCTPDEIRRYWRKIGAALLDRVELRVAAVSPDPVCLGGAKEEPSAAVADRVLKALEIQKKRFKDTGLRRNARMSPSYIDSFCPLTARAKEAFTAAAAKLGLSGRAYHGILRVARTIADLDEKDSLEAVHILEAVEHRRMGDDPYDIFSLTAS
jgi:magnesium chelatase family protein